MIKTIYGNVLDQQGLIVHGCNAQGVMGSGVAAGVRARWPNVYEQYREWCLAFQDPREMMGEVLCCKVGERQVIANAITQLNFGNGRQVDYDAIAIAFENIARDALERSKYGYAVLPIYFPLIGAGLGGGNWKIIKTIIEEMLKPISSTCDISLVLLHGTAEP